jgi:hypothetical protein
MVFIVLIVAVFLLFRSGALASTTRGSIFGPCSPLSNVFGTAKTPCGRLVNRPLAPGFRWNQGVIPSAPVLQPTLSIQLPAGQGKPGTGLSSAAGSAAPGSGGGGPLNTNATPAPTVIPSYAGLQPRTCATLSCGYPKGQQPYCLLNNCCVQREPCTTLGTSCTVTPYTPPCANAGGACYYNCLPGYCGPAPVCYSNVCYGGCI